MHEFVSKPFELEHVQADQGEATLDRKALRRNVKNEASLLWKGYWSLCMKYWEQKAVLYKGLQELPKNNDDHHSETTYTQQRVQNKLFSHFQLKKNVEFVRKFWFMYETDGSGTLEIDELIEIFHDGLFIWRELSKQELTRRWVENVSEGHGIAIKKQQIQDFYDDHEPNIFKAILNSLNDFVDNVKTLLDKDGSGEVEKEEFGNSFSRTAETLIEWYNNSLIIEAEKKLGSRKKHGYQSVTFKQLWLDEARKNDNKAAREKIFIYFWKALLMDCWQIEQISYGMKGLTKEFEDDVKRFVISQQCRHHLGFALQNIWLAFKNDTDIGLTMLEFSIIFEEAIEAWKRLAPSVTARKWADKYHKTKDKKLAFEEGYRRKQEKIIGDVDLKDKGIEISGNLNENDDDILDKAEFRDNFSTEVTAFVLDLHKECKAAGILRANYEVRFRPDATDSGSELELSGDDMDN